MCPCKQVVIADACPHLRGGPPGHSPNADLGRAHAMVRYFGVGTDPLLADLRLADALEAKIPYRPLDSCAALAEASVLGPASVTMTKGVAVVRPGTGDDLRIPLEAKAVAVDVTELPETDDAREAVHRVLRTVLHESVLLPLVEYRTCNGQPDEIAGFRTRGRRIEQFKCLRTEKREMIHGHGRALPLAVVVAPRLTPTAAWTAAMLRGAADAFIVGADVPMKIAESRWVGIGSGHGLAIRVSRYPALPDVLHADAPSLEAVAWTGPRLQPPVKNERAGIADLEHAPPPKSELSNREGDYRAAVIVAYAAVRTFFPYHHEILPMNDDSAVTPEARLEEALGMIQDVRISAKLALQRFGEVLRDGHNLVFDNDPQTQPYRPGRLQIVRTKSNEWGVLQSTSELVKPGDVVLAVNDQDVGSWLREQEKLVSGSRAKKLAQLGARIAADTDIRARTRAGEEKTVRIPEDNASRLAPPRREDPHVPGIAYVDLSKVTPDDIPRIRESLRAAPGGVILDMRGYPQRPAWTIAGDVCAPSSRGPEMAELEVTPFSNQRGAWQKPQSFLDWTTGRVPYDGPAVMLVGPETQSQAEHLVTFFRSQNRGPLIGQPTSGANGTITGVRLPGGFGFTFTGMYVRHHDGRPFHAIGHTPDIEVYPTTDDLEKGRDAALLRAVSELQKKRP